MSTHYLVVGLGSMGKRRIRNLQALGISQIVGFDLREDRRKEAADKYGIETRSSFEEAISDFKVKAMMISLPPDIHHLFMKKAVELGIPAFIEASVVDTDLKKIMSDAAAKAVFLAPSCTLHFHPAIRKVSEIIAGGELGTISNFLYHSGQYLPDWHPYEGVNEYYVSNKATGGGREIVPFELTWITLLLGMPKRVAGFYKKSIEIQGAEQIDDTYNLLMDYGGFIFNLSVDVVSRYATRRLVINGDKKQLYWSWDDNVIKVFDPVKNEWDEITYEIMSAQEGYNKNITEQMYISEVGAFIKGISNKAEYPSSLEHDEKVLNLLYAVEESSDTNTIISVK